MRVQVEGATYSAVRLRLWFQSGAICRRGRPPLRFTWHGAG